LQAGSPGKKELRRLFARNQIGWEIAMRFFVMVQGDEIIVTSPTGVRAAYFKRPYHPQLVLRRRTQTDDQELLARAWQAANEKARELGWIA
jgi:hypothetical protein